jgi:dihydrofolate reductase
MVFGRITYELMASFWPTPQAAKNEPVLAERMNALPKLVFSRTLKTAPWSNSTLVKDGLADAIRERKKGTTDMVIMGSGSIVSQLAPEGLIDQYQIVVIPIVLGKGRTMFEGVGKPLNLKLTKTRTFKNGSVFSSYEPSPDPGA